jgi:hypothetical protein
MGILTNSDDSADSLQNTAKSTNIGTLTKRAGWSDATVSGVEVSVLKPGSGGGGGTPATTPAPAETRTWPVMVAGVLGAVSNRLEKGMPWLRNEFRQSAATAHRTLQFYSLASLIRIRALGNILIMKTYQYFTLM